MTDTNTGSTDSTDQTDRLDFTPADADAERQALEAELVGRAKRTDDAGTLKALTAAIPTASDTAGRIRLQTAQGSEAFIEAIRTDARLGYVYEAAQAERAAALALSQQLTDIDAKLRDGIIGRQGAEIARTNAQKKYDATITQADEITDRSLDGFTVAHAGAMLPAAGADLGGFAQVAELQFNSATPEYFLEQVHNTLARASNPKTPAGDQLRANQELQFVFLPLSDRRATRPEPFAKHTATAYGQIAELIRAHLANVLGTTKAERARDIAETLRLERRAIRGMLRQNNGKWDDFLFPVAAPMLYSQSRADK